MQFNDLHSTYVKTSLIDIAWKAGKYAITLKLSSNLTTLSIEYPETPTGEEDLAADYESLISELTSGD